jgi:phosphoribosylanthranilate isomerase
VGFVVDYPRPVPWNISAGAAKKLMADVSGITETCIVTGGMPEAVLKLALEMRPDYVQLHYGESVSDTAILVRELRKHGIEIIKTVFPGTSEKTAVDLCATGLYALLYDPRTPENAVNGGAADFDAFTKLQSAVSCPVILAGGINPDNLVETVLRTGARSIDLMTGVERCPGIKDETKVAALFQALQTLSQGDRSKGGNL